VSLNAHQSVPQADVYLARYISNDGSNGMFFRAGIVSTVSIVSSTDNKIISIIPQWESKTNTYSQNGNICLDSDILVFIRPKSLSRSGALLHCGKAAFNVSRCAVKKGKCVSTIISLKSFVRDAKVHVPGIEYIYDIKRGITKIGVGQHGVRISPLVLDRTFGVFANKPLVG